jgi:hypothetical protein
MADTARQCCTLYQSVSEIRTESSHMGDGTALN